MAAGRDHLRKWFDRCFHEIVQESHDVFSCARLAFESAGDHGANQQAGCPNRYAHSEQVLAKISANVEFFPRLRDLSVDLPLQFLGCSVNALALLFCPMLQVLDWLRAHARFLTSLWIHNLSRFKTSNVRVGTIFLPLKVLTTAKAASAP